MKTYTLLFIAATGSSLVLTPIIRRLCERFHLLDHPGSGRRVHVTAVPRLGGVAILCGVLIGLAPLLDLHNRVTASLHDDLFHFLVILAPASLTFALGLFDDLYGLKAAQKFIGLAVAGAIFYALGGRIALLSIPFVGTVHLPSIIGAALTILWVVAIANAFNLIDGMDGLAAGAALFSSLVVMAVSLMQGRPLVIVFALVLSGSLAGFLRYNFNPASIFLGDSGALLVGFLLAALSVEGSQKASTAVSVAIPILAFGLPVVDTSITILRRLIARKPLFEGDREHIHHMLLQRGWSQRKTAFVLYGVCAVFGLLALLLGSDARLTGLILFVVSVAIVLTVGHLRYHELDEIKASVRRNFGDWHVRGANNIKVRRASQHAAVAATLAEWFGAIIEVLEAGGFHSAQVVVGLDQNPLANQQILKREVNSPEMRRAHLSQGMISWQWLAADPASAASASAQLAPEFKSLGPAELAQAFNPVADKMWNFRLPLSNGHSISGYLNFYHELGKDFMLLDLNYICTLFRRNLIASADRILTAEAASVAAKPEIEIPKTMVAGRSFV
jgi:UDP-GlcNAc:undecaprenyl-phosphate GlcNAc-1-phosphate transferase